MNFSERQGGSLGACRPACSYEREEIRMATQNGWVLAQLQSGRRLSSKDAVNAYGIQDLPKRISELRALGNKIESVRINGFNRRGMHTHWNVYFIKEVEQ